LSHKEIAARLGIALSTETSHMQHVSDVLNLSTRAEITRWCHTFPEALRGEWAPRSLHADDCSCDRPFCRANRDESAA